MKKKFKATNKPRTWTRNALAEPVAVSFTSIQRSSGSKFCSWVSFWNFQASVTLLNRLPFCFRFSLKGFIYFAVFECLNSFDFFVSLFFPEPEPDPAQGRDAAVSIISMQMKFPHSVHPWQERHFVNTAAHCSEKRRWIFPPTWRHICRAYVSRDFVSLP